MSFVITINIGFELNTSLQVGDEVYYNSVSTQTSYDQGDFYINTGGLNPQHFGTVENVGPTNTLSATEIDVRCPYVDASNNAIVGAIPPDNSYISFSKNQSINDNNLLGYYGIVDFENNSRTKAELFSVGSEVSESSK